MTDMPATLGKGAGVKKTKCLGLQLPCLGTVAAFPGPRNKPAIENPEWLLIKSCIPKMGVALSLPSFSMLP